MAFGLYLALLGGGQDATVARAAAFVFVVAANLGAAAVLAGAGAVGEGRQRMAFAAIAGIATTGVAAALTVAAAGRLGSGPRPMDGPVRQPPEETAFTTQTREKSSGLPSVVKPRARAKPSMRSFSRATLPHTSRRSREAA